MGIAFDAKTNTSVTGTASPLTFSHTCTGTDRILFVCAAVNTGTTVSSMTYAGSSMTLVGSVTDSAGPVTYLYYIVNPASGANNVVVTASATIYTTTAVSYTGAAQSGQLDASGTTAGSTTTSYTSTATVNTSNSWMVACSRTGSGFTLTAGANTVVRQQPDAVILGAGAFWDSGADLATGSRSLNVTSTSQLFGGAIYAVFKPVATANTNQGFFRLSMR